MKPCFHFPNSVISAQKQRFLPGHPPATDALTFRIGEEDRQGGSLGFFLTRLFPELGWAAKPSPALHLIFVTFAKIYYLRRRS